MLEGAASPNHLSDDPVLFKGIVRKLLATHHAQQRQVDQLTHHCERLLERVYGPQADQLDSRQLSLHDEPSPESSAQLVRSTEPDIIATSQKRNGHGRRRLLENCKRRTEIADIPESVKQATGGAWRKIGKENNEKLDYTPSSLFVRRIVSPKYVVRFSDGHLPDQLRIAGLPPEVLPSRKPSRDWWPM